jgi:glycerol-3-phosphate acyltransferase PlsX
MGSAYMKKILGPQNPRVGLLNNGAEEVKGTELQLEAYRLLKENELVNFVGNIEANYVMRNRCDVLVTDGFTGNILLKSIEGMGRLMLKTMKGLFSKNLKSKAAYALIRDEVAGIKKTFDSSEYGGAPILGIAKPVIKAHGSSKERAFKNAIRQAIEYSKAEIVDDISRDMKALADIRKAKKTEEKDQ